MDDDRIFAECGRLRRELADWLLTLTPQQLDARSLCAGWTVREVAGHLVAAVALPLRALLWQLPRSRFDPHRANAELARRQAARPLAELVGALREHADVELRQPVVGTRGPLTDLLVHDGDMRIPLGRPMGPDPDLATVALEFLAAGAPGFAPRRLAGLRLVATDLDRSWGVGAGLTGSGADLMMAMCGRRAVLDRLAGPGVPVLAARI